MRGALKVTYIDGTEEYYEVDPIGDNPDLAENLKIFLTSPHLTLVLPNEMHQYRNESKDEQLVMICAVPKEFE